MLMTVAAAAKELQTSMATIYRCIHAGAPCRRFGPTGKQYRVDPNLLLDWMDKQHEETKIIHELSLEQMINNRHALVR